LFTRFNKPEKAYLFVSLITMGYLVARAILVPLAHDEIATFYYYIQTGNYIPSFAHWDANNHVLNSAFGSLFYSVFGPYPLALRLSNLIFFPVFIYFSLLISRNIKSQFLQAAMLFSLLLMHNFIDFFGLSRGYGMSISLLMGSVYFLIAFFRTRKISHLIYILLFNFFFLAANLALYHITIIILALIIARIIPDLKKMSANEILESGTSLLILGVVPAIIYAQLLFFMQDTNLLYYGSDDGMWAVTARSLIRMLSGSESVLYEIFWAGILIIAVALGLTGSVKKVLKKQVYDPQILLFLLFSGSVVMVLGLNFILGVNYPEDRVGLYFFPLLIMSYFFSADILFKRRFTIIMLVPFLWLPVDLSAKINFRYSECYKTDLIPERFFKTVSIEKSDSGFPATIGSYRTRHFVWSYYDFLRDGTQNQIFWANYPGNETDFLITELDDYPGWQEYYEAIDYDDINKRHLLKRKIPIGCHLIEQRPVKSSGGPVDKTFWELYDSRADTLIGEDIMLSFDLDIESPSEPFQARLVASVHDREGKDLRYEYIQSDWIRKQWRSSDGNLRNSLILHDLPEESYKIKLYLWSIHSHTYAINDGYCRLEVLLAD